MDLWVDLKTESRYVQHTQPSTSAHQLNENKTFSLTLTALSLSDQRVRDQRHELFTATCWSWIFHESNFLYSGDPIRYNQFNCISRLAKPSFVLLIFWKCKTESSELGLKNIFRRYYQKRTNRGGYLLPSLRRCGIE